MHKIFSNLKGFVFFKFDSYGTRISMLGDGDGSCHECSFSGRGDCFFNGEGEGDGECYNYGSGCGNGFGDGACDGDGDDKLESEVFVFEEENK
jgi:hypothetical protein